MWSTRIISDDGLSSSGDGFDLDIRLPWYRSLPLSVIHAISVEVDGEAVPPDAISLRVDGKDFGLDELEDAYETWWHILDSGILHVRDFPLAPGSTHQVGATVTFEIPYVPGAIIPSTCVKTLRVKELGGMA